jgi:hypothetical protein
LALGPLLYGCVLVALRALDREDWASLASALGRRKPA